MSEPHPIQDTETLVCQDILARQAVGKEKYGTTLAENPLTPQQWRQHKYEELLDATLYSKREMQAYEAWGDTNAENLWAENEKLKASLKDARRDLNRRAHIEQVMFNAAGGARPMPTPDELRLWALALGTPKKLWSQQIEAAVKAPTQ